MLRSLRSRFLVWGVSLTWLVGGVLAIVGYRQMTLTIRREALARVEDAVRVGQRLIETQFDQIDLARPLPAGVTLLTFPYQDLPQNESLRTLAIRAKERGKAEGFALLDGGLCIVSIRPSLEKEKILIAIRPLKAANWLTDQIRNVVFGSPARGSESATVTIFEKDVRIATNVIMPDGQRAVGTRASKEVAHRVLKEGRPWKDRAFVVDRWMITYYQPIWSPEGEVIGMLYAGLDEKPYVAEGERDIAFFLTLILGLSMVVSGAAWYMGRRLSRPMTDLTIAAAALGGGERKNLQVLTNDPEEVKVLAETFNKMTGQVIAHANELMSSREKAQKALNDYLEVLGFVAHELKSPIAGALTQLMVIEDGYAGKVPENLSRPLAAIHRYLEYGHEMALSFNQLSRAESEGFVAHKELLADFNEEVTRPAITDFSAEAARHRMAIKLQGESTSIRVDPDLMRVTMDNLIGNAVKYGQEGTEIRVIALKTKQGLRVEVWNQGVGVPKERFPQLFAKFFRVQDPKLKTRKGTGVGLYLVRKIVELHGGQVGVDGEYGKWIKFWFEIPSGDFTKTEGD